MAKILAHLDEMLTGGVVEDTTSLVLLSCHCTVPKCDFPKDSFVVDLSALNRFLVTRKSKIVTIVQVWLHL